MGIEVRTAQIKFIKDILYSEYPEDATQSRWRRKGTTMELLEEQAKELVERGDAIYIDEPNKVGIIAGAEIPLNEMNPSQRISFEELHPERVKIKEPTKEFKDATKVFHSKIEQAEIFNEQQPVYYDDGGMFWLWNNGTKSWIKIERDADICNLLNFTIGADTINAKERGEIFQALKQVGRMHKPIPMPKTWIQFKNGIIDIKDEHIIKDVTPEYFTVNPIPWNIGSSDETPNMDRIFEQWVGKEYIKTLYQIIAYCLLPDYPLNRLFCFIGAGLNGKSKYLDLLRKFLGESNCTSTELEVLLRSRFEITKLHKKLICQMGETNFNEMSNTSVLKKLTGGDLIGFEYKNKTPFEALNYAKIIISTNNLPTTTDKTIGFYRRWLIVDFPNQFTEKKNILDEIPDVEYENLAYKSIKILKELLSVREFHNEGSIEDRMKRYEDHSDPLEKFMKEFVSEDANGKIWKFEFEKRLNEWCKEHKFRTIAENTIGRKMKEKGIGTDYIQSDWLIDGYHKRLRAWIGIIWNEVKSSVNSVQDVQDVQVTSTYSLHMGNKYNKPAQPAQPAHQPAQIDVLEFKGSFNQSSNFQQ